MIDGLAIVTGGAAGRRQALASRLAAEGADVLVADLEEADGRSDAVIALIADESARGRVVVLDP